MEAASKIVKRISMGKCELMKYFDRGSRTWNYCLQLCNKGGGQQADCHSLCPDYLKCIGRQSDDLDSGAQNMQNHIGTLSLSAGSIAAIVISICVCFIIIVAGAIILYRKFHNQHVARRNMTPPVPYINIPNGEDLVNIHACDTQAVQPVEDDAIVTPEYNAVISGH